MSMRLGRILRMGWIGLGCLSLASCTWTYRAPPSDTYLGPPPAPAASPEGAEQGPARPAEKSAEKPSAPAAETPAAAPDKVEIGVQEAVLTAMEHNQSLAVERYTPRITRTGEIEEQGVFDPLLSATGQSTRESVVPQPTTRRFNQAAELQAQGGQNAAADLQQVLRRLAPVISNLTLLQAGALQFFPTGTTVGLDISSEFNETTARRNQVQNRLGLSVTQALLRGFGPEVNLARIRQARIDTLSTQYQLRGFAELLVSQVEQTYWDYVLAKKQIDIFEQSRALAEKQLSETKERIRVGTLAEIEQAAAESEVALRKEDLIDARSALAKIRLQFVRLLNPQVPAMWTRDISPLEPPLPPEESLDDVESHVKLALRMRPDLNQAKLQVERGDLEIVRTKNGLLPQLDLFFMVGKSGYGIDYSSSWKGINDAGYDLLFGMTTSYPVGNHAAQGQYQRAVLSRSQAIEAVNNFAQLIEVDVRSAYIEVDRARQQVAASAVTRKLMEAKLKAEQEKFAVGRSTSLLVATADRDLLSAQITEITAVVAHLKALVVMYHMEGTLLERRGIIAPGREPVDLSKQRM